MRFVRYLQILVPALAASFTIAGSQTTQPAATSASSPHSSSATVPWDLRDLSTEDAAMIGNTARRVFAAALTGTTPPVVAYRPPTLRNVHARVHLTVRSRGKVAAEGESGDVDVLDGVRAAAQSAARGMPATFGRNALDISRLGIEVELLGPEEFVAGGLDEKLHFEQALYDAFEPGVDGVGVALRERRGRARAGTIIASCYTPPLALQHAESDCGFVAKTKEQNRGAIRYFRFPCVHIWQADAPRPPRQLYRGMMRVPQSDVTIANVDACIRMLESHVRRRARRDAWLAYEYLPSAEQFSEFNSLFGQFQAAAALGDFGRATQCRPCVDIAQRLTAAARTFVQPILADIPAQAIIATKDAPPLATTAIYLSLVCRFPSDELTIKPTPLADALRMVQDHATGRFTTTFPPEAPAEGHAEAAVYAMRGLLDFAEARPNVEVDSAVRLGVRHYANYLAKLPSRELAAALPSAMLVAYRRRPDPPVSDLAFAAADWLCAHQVRQDGRVAPELVGAIVDPSNGICDAGTARCLLALADAHQLAERLGDRQRQSRYADGGRLAARFVLQLQVRAEECFYSGDVDDLVGGIRVCPWDHRLRVDDSAMALWALYRAKQEGIIPAQ